MNSLQSATPDTSAYTNRCASIRQLNDTFRQTFLGGRVVTTYDIAALPDVTRAAIIAAVQAFDRFDADSDPYGEHDFGMFEADDTKVLWRIEYYDHALQMHSPDAANPRVTTRVLTIMLASEM